MTNKYQRTEIEELHIRKALQNIIPLHTVDIEKTISEEVPYMEEYALTFIDAKNRDKEIDFSINLN